MQQFHCMCIESCHESCDWPFEIAPPEVGCGPFFSARKMNIQNVPRNPPSTRKKDVQVAHYICTGRCSYCTEKVAQPAVAQYNYNINVCMRSKQCCVDEQARRVGVRRSMSVQHIQKIA